METDDHYMEAQDEDDENFLGLCAKKKKSGKKNKLKTKQEFFDE